MDINPKTLYKPFTRAEEMAVAKYAFRTGVSQAIAALVMHKWAGDHKNQSRGVAGAVTVTVLAALAWAGVAGQKYIENQEV